MKTIQKFYDASGKEAEPKDAVKCVELTIDDKGKVVSTQVYLPKPK